MTDSYICSLSNEASKKAKKELGEDPKEREGAVQTFREWILTQKHIKCDTGEFCPCNYRVWIAVLY